MDMALVAVILGGLFGFANFLAALFIYDAGFVTALGIYSASGIVFALCIIFLTLAFQTLLPQQRPRTIPREPSTQQF